MDNWVFVHAPNTVVRCNVGSSGTLSIDVYILASHDIDTLCILGWCYGVLAQEVSLIGFQNSIIFNFTLVLFFFSSLLICPVPSSSFHSYSFLPCTSPAFRTYFIHKSSRHGLNRYHFLWAIWANLRVSISTLNEIRSHESPISARPIFTLTGTVPSFPVHLQRYCNNRHNWLISRRVLVYFILWANGSTHWQILPIRLPHQST